MGEDAGIRDRLALQRTVLANERTVLSYARTAIALTAAGASTIYFGGDALVDAVGGAFVAGGLVVMAVGVRRYRHVRSLIAEYEGDIARERDAEAPRDRSSAPRD